MGLSGRFDRKMKAVELEIPARSDRPARLQLERRRLRGTGGGRRATPHGSPGPFTAPFGSSRLPTTPHGPSRPLAAPHGPSRPATPHGPSQRLTVPHGPSRPGRGRPPGELPARLCPSWGFQEEGEEEEHKGGNRTNSAEAQGEIRQPVLGGAMLGAPGLRQRG